LAVDELRCRHCDTKKPISEFDRSFFNKRGFDVYCHECRIEIDEKHDAVVDKQCRQCGRVRDISEFGETSSSRDGYYKECIDCQMETRSRKRYRKNEATWDGKTNICRSCGKEKPNFEFVPSRYDSGGTGYCMYCHSEMHRYIYQEYQDELDKVGYSLEHHCKKCGRLLPLDQFALDRCKKDGLDDKCLDCRKEQFEEYNQKLIENRKKNPIKKNVKKECNSCHQLKPLIDFTEYVGNKDGRSDKCIICTKKQREENAQSWMEDRKKKKINLTEKKCRECDRVLPIDMFSRSRNNKYGFYTICDDCRIKKQKVYEEGWGEERKKTALEFTFDVLTEKKCLSCGNIVPISGFGDRKASKDGKAHYCLNCSKIKDLERNAKLKKRGIVPELFPDEKYCPGCKKTLPYYSFRFISTSGNCLDGQCQDCRDKYYEEYKTRPEVIQKKKEYLQRPEVKERKRINSRKSYHRRKKMKAMEV